MAEINVVNNSFEVKFKYDRDVVDQIKALPYSDRKWNQENKSWVVSPKHSKLLEQMFPGDVPKLTYQSQIPEKTSIRLLYLGQSKQRDDGTYSAFGYTDAGWNIVIPDTVIKEWFLGTEDAPKIDTSTFYGTLGLSVGAGSDEIKSGYKRMAKQWHPDLCKEKDANEIFLKIKAAYEILSDEDKKTRYDVGLLLSSTTRKKSRIFDDTAYKPPLRCGNLSAIITHNIGRIIVNKIICWDDIVENGKTLVTSWVMGCDAPIMQWSQA